MSDPIRSRGAADPFRSSAQAPDSDCNQAVKSGTALRPAEKSGPPRAAENEAPLSTAEHRLVERSQQSAGQQSARSQLKSTTEQPAKPELKTPPSSVLKQDPIIAQARLDRVCRELQLQFPHAPRYGQTAQGNDAETGTDGTTVVGDAAFRSDALLRSTLIHEHVHQRQVETGNFAKFARSAGNVSELEAYRAELLPQNLEKSRLSSNDQRQVQQQYLERVDNLLLQGSVGRTYAKQALLNDNFELRPQDRLVTLEATAPAHSKTAKATQP